MLVQPVECGDLVRKPEVTIRDAVFESQKAERAKTVVDGYNHNVASADERASIKGRIRSRAVDEGAAVNPEHDRFELSR